MSTYIAFCPGEALEKKLINANILNPGCIQNPRVDQVVLRKKFEGGPGDPLGSLGVSISTLEPPNSATASVYVN